MKVWIVDSDSEKLEILDIMRDEGLDKVVVYSLDECSDEDWLKLLHNAWALTIKDDQGPVGIGWFDHQEGHSVFCHFVLFDRCQSRAKEFGEVILQWLEEKVGVRTFLGTAPKAYRHSRNLVKLWGFEELTVVPQMCYFAKYKKYTDGVLYMRTV